MGYINASSVSSVLMALYIGFAALNLYKLMYPLTGLDVSEFRFPQDFVHPLWSTGSKLHMQIYLSTKKRFTAAHLKVNSEQQGPPPFVLLFDDTVDAPSFTKSILLATTSDKEDPSRRYATHWLDHAEHSILAELDAEAGVLSALSQATGHGIESTSFLLILYESVAKQIRSILETIGLVRPRQPLTKRDLGVLDRSTVQLPENSPIWHALQSNSTVHVHVLVTKGKKQEDDAASYIQKVARTSSLLMGQVSMIKYDQPNHIEKPKRLLYQDILYYWKRHIRGSDEMPPWVMEISKPEDAAAYKHALELKQRGAGYPYWKPEVSIKFVMDTQSFPKPYAHLSGMPMVKVNGDSSRHPTHHAYMPVLHVDEIGMTSEKYIPMNATVKALPLMLAFDRSDMEHKVSRNTATAGSMSAARYRLLAHLGEAIEKQKEFGFEESDIDDVKRLIADTNVTLLAITMLASALHLLFEFLTFKSEVSFWQKNKDLTGLSVRSLFLDMLGQTIVLFFLIEKESSLLMTIPSGIGCLIALWKCQRASGFKFIKARDGPCSVWNRIPRLFGYELNATRLETSKAVQGEKTDETTRRSSRQRLIDMTIESDRLASQYLGAILLPVTAVYTIYSLFYDEHRSWYSWLITSLASAVYALGFVLMTPQLFLNWKMKSVAHLPWRVLCYKTLNTFIDDLFSFIIRMPTMARISCFRDDVVFFIYLYQRWLYPVDTSRPVEGGGDAPDKAEEVDSIKKKQ